MESGLAVVPSRIPRRVRATVFGRDAATYDAARLPYPRRVYEILVNRCNLRPGATVFEIGPGTGIATRELLRRGARPLTLIEPDRRLARYLRSSLGVDEERFRIEPSTFARARLSRGSFDLGVAASSFHWTRERPALRKVARSLRPGGWWAMWNNHHGDPYRSSPFHQALQPVYRKLYHGHVGGVYDRASANAHRARRLAALRGVDQFDRIKSEQIHWSANLPTERVTALWGTFSDTQILPPRKRTWFLGEVSRIADEQFGSKVTLRMWTPIYTARKA